MLPYLAHLAWLILFDRRALALFLKKPASSTIDISVVHRNRKNALGLLKAASEKDAVIFHETGVMAWSQLGR